MKENTTSEMDPTFANKNPMEILVVEDNALNQKAISMLLKRLGYHPHLAPDGKEGLALTQKNDYHLIFMDLVMPEMDGYELAQHIVSHYKDGKRPYIVALTANIGDESFNKSLLSGMDAYMTKPITSINLTHALEKSLKRDLDKYL